SEPSLALLPWVHRVDLGDFLAQTEQAKARRTETARVAEPLLAGAAERLRKRAEARHQRSGARTAQDRLAEAWGGLEAEALAGPLGKLGGVQQEALVLLLKRGRTLAFRALAHTPPEEQS
ncbi:MAG TPA: hypothetical protein VN436_07520, partial [Holophaga sp.]|nr:hypothetical protein [Holophaga sp.]